MQRNVLKGFLTHHTKVRLIAVAIILLFDARGTLARAAEAEKLNVFYSSIAASSVVTWIPKEAGIYKKYGLDVNLRGRLPGDNDAHFRQYPDRTRLRRGRCPVTPIGIGRDDRS